ncbi:MAG TPA: ABC transporter ATP-binding protein [Bryobacteraceae bacterium]|nr:ABC transporter ATP-binding protein [Bryobacteraceae bacterium]
MSNPIATHNLSKAFRSTEAVRALTLEVPEGGIYALIGPNGAGKTTTIKLLMNILRASAGSAEVLGVDSRRLSPREFARIGYVSENQEMPEWMTVDYFLAYLKPFYPTWDDALAAGLVRQFELPLDRKLRHLSRGMRMKAALASSLAYRPELVVLDEPFTGLDALVRDEFTRSLLERAEGTTILIASHDLADIENFASHVGYIEEGRLRFSEEMGTLAGRFRQVEIAFDAPPPLPAHWPAGWMRPETSGAVLRFIDSRFDAERTAAELGRAFPGARNVEFHAMTLREIFVALALAGRQAKAA